MKYFSNSIKQFCLVLTACLLGIGAMAQVTFQVDMSNQMVDAAGVHIAGDFQGWDPAATPLTDIGGGVWAITIPALTPLATYQYKFVNGNVWGMDEAVPGACSNGGNREVTISATADETLPAVCYAACTVCAPPVVDVTFQVDMTNEVVDAAGVHIAGAFQGWDPSTTPLTDMGAGVWAVTLSVDEGAAYEYKFVNGNAWGQDEVLSGACVSNGNRSIIIPAGGGTIDIVCYNSCDACIAGVPGCTDVNAQNYDAAATADDGTCAYLITFSVDMNNVCVGPNGVHIAGAFQGWDPATTAMDDSDNDGVYTVTLTVPNGNNEYKFINGNAWGSDESVPVECASGTNRSVVVAGVDEALPTVCYASCAACSAPANVGVTVQVDMSELIVDAAGVFVAGDFNAWDATANALTDLGGGLWSATIDVAAGSGVQYIFYNGASGETVPVECGVDNNGSLVREVSCVSEATTVDPVCFSSCGACVSSLVNVTFQVDLSNVTINPIGAFIVGSFQSVPWTAGLDQMVNAGGGVFTYTTLIPSNTTIEYKYLNGPNFANEETVPSSCGVDNGLGGFNRSFAVADVDVTIPLHCFSSCNSCATLPVDVTFQVDMSQQVVDAAGVHIAGVFQGWDPSATLMTDMGGGIWSYTASIQPGEAVQYKFVNGNAWGMDESVPAPCNVGGNRSFTPGTSNETVPAVCYGACLACSVPDADVTIQVDMSNEVVDAAGVHIAGSFQGWDPAATPMTDLGGGIWAITISVQEGSTVDYKFVNGNAWGLDEAVPVECANAGNRSFLVPVGGATLDVVCFASCTICNTDVAGCLDPAAQNYDAAATVSNGSCLYKVTFRVDMANQGTNAANIMGDFQGWDPLATPMTNVAYDIFQFEGYFTENTTLTYKFVNGETVYAEAVPVECGVDDGFGGFNRTIDVGTADQVVTLCFESCTLCEGCTDPMAAEFNPFAGVDNGSCLTAVVEGCTYADATNYNAAANVDNGSCEFGPMSNNCPEDLNQDGVINAGDLLQFLGSFGTTCL
jgi:1,4-alpha-glucan branching enzyme